MKLKNLINESWLDDSKALTSKEKRAFLEAVAKFNDFGKSIYRGDALREAVESIIEMAEQAKSFTLTETEGTFDSITVNRHMKRLSESIKVFSKTANEITNLQQRLESCYEEIGSTLGKYYDIREIQEELDPLGKDDTDDDGETDDDVEIGSVRDIDNDGDVDDSDEYLANRRKDVTKAIRSRK